MRIQKESGSVLEIGARGCFLTGKKNKKHTVVYMNAKEHILAYYETKEQAEAVLKTLVLKKNEEMGFSLKNKQKRPIIQMPSIDEATYLAMGYRMIPKETGKGKVLKAYVDGSYSKIGTYGVIFFEGTKQVGSLSGVVTIGKELKSNGAELSAARAAIDYAIKKHYHHVSIYYDFEGVALWSKERPNKQVSDAVQDYINFIFNARKKISIEFCKVKGHKDVLHNKADKLARDLRENLEASAAKKEKKLKATSATKTKTKTTKAKVIKAKAAKAIKAKKIKKAKKAKKTKKVKGGLVPCPC